METKLVSHLHEMDDHRSHLVIRTSVKEVRGLLTARDLYNCSILKYYMSPD